MPFGRSKPADYYSVRCCRRTDQFIMLQLATDGSVVMIHSSPVSLSYGLAYGFITIWVP